MLYLFAANEFALIEKAIRKTVDSILESKTPFNYSKYDLREVLISDVLETAETISFDSDKRVIVLDHASFLTRNTEKSVNKEIDDRVLKSLSQLSEDVTLIFIARSSDINDKHKLFKYIQNNGKVNIKKDIDKKEWNRFIRTFFTRAQVDIDDNAVNELVNRFASLGAFLQEGEKLVLYGERVTLDIVNELVTPLLEENSYALVNALISGDKSKTFQIYQDFKTQNQEPIAFIALVANQFRFYAQVYILLELGMTNEEISSRLAVNPYRVKLAIEQRRRTSLDQVFNVLLSLAKLDYEIKSGQIDRFFGFELFLLNY